MEHQQMRERERKEYRKYKGDEGRMKTDMALSEFPAFTDNNTSQPSSRVVCHIEKLIVYDYYFNK